MIITRLCYAPAVWERSWGQTQLWPAALCNQRGGSPTLEHLLQADYKTEELAMLSVFDSVLDLFGTEAAFHTACWLVYFHDNYTACVFPYTITQKAAEHSMKSRLTAQWLRCSDRRQTERKTIHCDKTCRCDCPLRLTERTHTQTHTRLLSIWMKTQHRLLLFLHIDYIYIHNPVLHYSGEWMHVQDEDVIHSGIFLYTVHLFPHISIPVCCSQTQHHSTLHPRHVFLLCFTSLELTAAFTSHCSLCKAHINMPSCIYSDAVISINKVQQILIWCINNLTH